MRRLLLLGALPCALLASASASAQSHASSPAPAARAFGPFGPRYLDVDSIALGLGTRSMWRGFHQGDFPLSLGIDLALWRIDGPRERHTLIGGAEAVIPLADRDDDRVDLFELGGGYRFAFDTEDGELRLGAAARSFASPGASDWTSEIVAALQRRVPAPGTELRPLVGVVVARDLDRFEATWVQPHASLDVGIPRDDNAWSVGGRLGVTTSLSDYPRRDADDGFGHHATSLGLWLYGDRATTPVGPLLAEVGVEHWWSSVDVRDRRFVWSLRFVKR